MNILNKVKEVVFSSLELYLKDFKVIEEEGPEQFGGYGYKITLQHLDFKDFKISQQLQVTDRIIKQYKKDNSWDKFLEEAKQNTLYYLTRQIIDNADFFRDSRPSNNLYYFNKEEKKWSLKEEEENTYVH